MARKRKTIGQEFSPFEISAQMNARTYEDYFNRMMILYMGLWRYQNLPEEIDQRFLKRMLMWKQGIAFFEDEILEKVIAMPFHVFGIPDRQNNPITIQVYSPSTGFTRMLDRKEFEIVWANYLRYPPIVTIQLFAERIASIQRTIDVNVNNQKTPKIVKTSQVSRLSLKNILTSIEGYVPIVEVDEGFNSDVLLPLDISSPYVTDKLDIHKNVAWNEFLTWCGIENTNMDKKERMVAGEVNGNYGNIEGFRNTSHECLQEGFDRVNRRFGTHITVGFNSDMPTILNTPDLIASTMMGGEGTG